MVDASSLRGQVQRDLVAGKPLGDLLRSCLLLGGQSGSAELRAWATKELDGYDQYDELPKYRIVQAIIQRDGISGNWRYTGQEIPLSIFPERVRDGDLVDRVHLRAGVGELEAATKDGATNGKIRLSFPGANELARLLDNGAPFEQTTSIYWALAPATMIGVVDRIRTAMTEFLVELGAFMPDHQDQPTAEQVSHALHIAVSGGSPVFTVSNSTTSTNASGGSTIEGVTGGQAGAAGRDLHQNATTSVSHNEAIKTTLKHYRAALSELDPGVQSFAATQIDQAVAEIEKPEPQEAVVRSLLSSLKSFATSAITSAGTGAGAMGLAEVIAHWPL